MNIQAIIKTERTNQMKRLATKIKEEPTMYETLNDLPKPASREVTKPGRPALNIQQILVPTDFSEYSKKALKYAASVAEQFGAKITLLHVAEPSSSYPYAGYPFVAEPEEIMPPLRAAVDQACEKENINPRLIRETLVKVGEPYQEIANTAKALKTDLIVIATHGRTGLAHILLGSTTEHLVRHAPCPVLVVREKEREFGSA
jgi:nucleotide-binding universal stress UspA family protein